METLEIQERYTKKAVRALKQEQSEIALYLKAMGEKLEAPRLAGKRAGDGRRIWNATHATKKDTSRGSARPTQLKDARETEETVMVVNGLYLPGRIEGNRVSFLVDTGSGVSILAAQTWRKWGGAEGELTRYWGRLCSVEGRALQCLGRTRLTVTLGTRAIKWNFIVAEIGDDEGILGNDFAMAHELTVRPCEGAVYLPSLSKAKEEHMGQRLPCTIRSVTEVRAGPGPLGLCPVRGVVKVEQDSRIWLANTGPQPIRIEENEVVAMAVRGSSVASTWLADTGKWRWTLRTGKRRPSSRKVGFTNLGWSECLVDMDDILVFGPDFAMMLARLESVLDRLEGQEVSVIQGGDSFFGPYSIGCGDRSRPERPT